MHRPTSTATASTTAGRCSTTTTSSRAATPCILAQMNGTGYSTGCPTARRPGRHRRHQGRSSTGSTAASRATRRRPAHPVTSPTGTTARSAMIGKSYDGTLANGVAATGVDGLTTIVPISAISDWYDYSRTGGIRHNTNYPASLNDASRDRHVTNRRRPAGPQRSARRSRDADERRSTATTTRRHQRSSGTTATTSRTSSKVKAAVFVTHGIQDDNVAPDHVSAVVGRRSTANNVPRKLWLLRAGPRRPVRLPPRRVGRHAAPLVRLLALGRPRTGS